jgi:hypothetical protein
MRMTKDRAKDILIHAGPEVLDSYRPIGVSLGECIEAALEVSQGEELDLIAEHFGLVRQGGTFMVGSNMGASDPETDVCFRDRIISHFLPATPKTKAHSHSWKFYQGFTDTYEYCETCDEKRRK